MRARPQRPLVALLAALAVGCSPPPPGPARGEPGWAELEDGLELGLFPVDPAQPGGGSIHVVRLDPARFELRLLNASGADGVRRTARQWSEREGLAATINASMYQEDYVTAVSLMRRDGHINNGHLTKHRAVLMFDRVDPDDPPTALVDLSCESYDDWKDRYRSHVQSIRMVSCHGENVWAPGDRRWSTAAIGVDERGRTLFVHAGTPLTTHELIDRVLELPLRLAGLMYAEGGPQAQLYVDSETVKLELVGRFESVPGASAGAWPVPNVIGAVRRPAGGAGAGRSR